MGVVSAMVGLNRKSNGERPRVADDSERVQAIRDATLEDGIKHLMATMDNLVELDRRLAVVENELVGAGTLNLGDLPQPRDIGLDGFVPRLMEAGLIIGAMTRRMHLRLGVISGALGCGAKPVSAVDGSATRITAPQPTSVFDDETTSVEIDDAETVEKFN